MFRRDGDEEKIIQALDYKFKDKKLLLQALTRRSALNEGRQITTIGDFQRLEFIGDKVLNLVISDVLLENNPTWEEGRLTIEASKWVNNKGPLAQIASNLGLGNYLIMGSGEEKQNKARENTKVLSDAFEAVLGAIWLDSDKNFQRIRKFVLKQFNSIGLRDFNQEYEKLVVKFARITIANKILEDLMPEIFEAEGGREMSVCEMMQFGHAKQKATKPLSGLAASLENFLQSSADGEATEESLITLGGTEDSTFVSDAGDSKSERSGTVAAISLAASAARFGLMPAATSSRPAVTTGTPTSLVQPKTPTKLQFGGRAG